MHEDRATELTGTAVKIYSPSMADTKSQTAEAYIAHRYVALAKTNNSSLVIGSSLAHQQTAVGEEAVLDAAAMTWLIDERHVVSGFRQATADGLGGSASDPLENSSIAGMAHFSCQTYINSDAKPADSYLEIAKQSEAQSLTMPSGRKYDSTCAMATASFLYDGKGAWQGTLANMGDTLVLILDADLKIKRILPPKQQYQGYGIWSPESVQSLSTDPTAFARLQTCEIMAQEGDLVITMTDGVWSEFPGLSQEEDNETRRTIFDVDKLASVLQQFALPPHAFLHDLATCLLTVSSENLLKKNRLLLNVVEGLEQAQLPASLSFVDQVIDYLACKDMAELARDLQHILFDNACGDGVQYHKGVSIPFSYVMRELRQRSLGDCSTLQITRLPYRLDELIRAFIKNPARSREILPELRAHITSEQALEQAITRLKAEQALAQSGVLLADAHVHPVFFPEKLERVESILRLEHQLHNMIVPRMPLADRLNLVRNLMNEHLPHSLHQDFYNLVKYWLKPPSGFYSFFNFYDRKLLYDFERALNELNMSLPGTSQDMHATEHKICMRS